MMRVLVPCPVSARLGRRGCWPDADTGSHPCRPFRPFRRPPRSRWSRTPARSGGKRSSWITFDKFHIPFVEPFFVEPFEFQLSDRMALEEAKRAVELSKEEMERAHEFQLFDHDLVRFEIEKATKPFGRRRKTSRCPEDQHAGLHAGAQAGREACRAAFVVGRSSEAGRVRRKRPAGDPAHQYDQAITLFEQVIVRKDTRADAAVYWKAFAQFKSAKSADAQASIALAATRLPPEPLPRR